MPMDRDDLLNAIVDDGVYEVTTEYTGLDQRVRYKRDGAIAGLEACRARNDAELLALRDARHVLTEAARAAEAPDYWYVRYFELQVEWVLEVLSAAEIANGRQPHVRMVGVRAMRKAADIIGVASGV